LEFTITTTQFVAYMYLGGWTSSDVSPFRPTSNFFSMSHMSKITGRVQSKISYFVHYSGTHHQA